MGWFLFGVLDFPPQTQSGGEKAIARFDSLSKQLLRYRALNDGFSLASHRILLDHWTQPNTTQPQSPNHRKKRFCTGHTRDDSPTATQSVFPYLEARAVSISIISFFLLLCQSDVYVQLLSRILSDWAYSAGQ